MEEKKKEGISVKKLLLWTGLFAAGTAVATVGNKIAGHRNGNEVEIHKPKISTAVSGYTKRLQLILQKFDFHYRAMRDNATNFDLTGREIAEIVLKQTLADTSAVRKGTDFVDDYRCFMRELPGFKNYEEQEREAKREESALHRLRCSWVAWRIFSAYIEKNFDDLQRVNGASCC